jgi:hypothetical protein
MSELFAGAYIVPDQRDRLESDADPTAASFYDSIHADEFPYDIGDDPAFFSARYHKAPVTWGVCRPDVRCKIRPDDWMIFFAAERDGSPTTRYRFAAACRVERKISQQEIFACQVESVFRSYLNLLIRPLDRGWEHFEPCLRKPKWHKDWLWRICKRNDKSFSKEEIVVAGIEHQDGNPLTVRNSPAPITDNYVIFSKSQSIIARDPPHVATHDKGQSGETWRTDVRSKRIRALIFGIGERQCLRTSNPQQPHRHFHRPLCDATWAEQLFSAIQ